MAETNPKTIEIDDHQLLPSALELDNTPVLLGLSFTPDHVSSSVIGPNIVIDSAGLTPNIIQTDQSKDTTIKTADILEMGSNIKERKIKRNLTILGSALLGLLFVSVKCINIPPGPGGSCEQPILPIVGLPQPEVQIAPSFPPIKLIFVYCPEGASSSTSMLTPSSTEIPPTSMPTPTKTPTSTYTPTPSPTPTPTPELMSTIIRLTPPSTNVSLTSIPASIETPTPTYTPTPTPTPTLTPTPPKTKIFEDLDEEKMKHLKPERHVEINPFVMALYIYGFLDIANLGYFIKKRIERGKLIRRVLKQEKDPLLRAELKAALSYLINQKPIFEAPKIKEIPLILLMPFFSLKRFSNSRFWSNKAVTEAKKIPIQKSSPTPFESWTKALKISTVNWLAALQYRFKNRTSGFTDNYKTLRRYR